MNTEKENFANTPVRVLIPVFNRPGGVDFHPVKSLDLINLAPVLAGKPDHHRNVLRPFNQEILLKLKPFVLHRFHLCKHTIFLFVQLRLIWNVRLASIENHLETMMVVGLMGHAVPRLAIPLALIRPILIIRLLLLAPSVAARLVFSVQLVIIVKWMALILMRVENVYPHLFPKNLLPLVLPANGGITPTKPALPVRPVVKDYIGIPLANPANQALPALAPHP